MRVMGSSRSDAVHRRLARRSVGKGRSVVNAPRGAGGDRARGPPRFTGDVRAAAAGGARLDGGGVGAQTLRVPRTIRQTVTFRASPERLFALYASSREHSAATGARAVVSRRVGGAFSAYGGHLCGRNLAMVPGRLIVQSWRGSDWR